MADDLAGPAGVKPGDTIEGRYRVIRAIDQGGMGSVFLAEHVLIKRRVAVKFLRGELAEDADVLDRFMNEARAAGTLGHPNIVESTDMGFTRDGLPYIVFEYLEGTLLTDEIYRVAGFPIRRTLRIARQIGSALGAAHATGIVHRDLKADNVFLIDRDDAPDHVKVLDFGVSRFLDGDGDQARNRDLIVGTPQFMAPEQISSPDRVDQRADIYALGVIIYEMLTARRPFANPDPDALFEQILTEAPPGMDLPALPRGFEDMLLTKFLAKRPEDRFQTMKEVETALEGYADMVRPSLDSIPIARISDVALPSAPPPALPQAAAVVSLPAPPHRARLEWLVVALACLGAGVALLVVRGRAPEVLPPDPAPLRADADRLAAAIDSATHTAELRADGFAQSPQLRAAAETDAATVKDMLHDDFILNQAKGEVFELYQRHDGKTVPLLVKPEGPPMVLPADHQPRLHSDGKTLAVWVTALIKPHGDEVGGVALLVPIDLAGISSVLAGHTTTVTLRGLGTPLPLAQGTGVAPVRLEAPVPIMRELGTTLTLSATLPETLAEPDPRLAAAQVGAWAGGGLFALLYAGSLIRARRRG